MPNTTGPAVARRAPHRPERAQLTHSVLRRDEFALGGVMTQAVLRRELGRRIPNVVTRVRSFSPTVPFATPRLPPMGSPAFNRYYETAKTAASVAPFASVSLARGVLRSSSCFARHGREERGPDARTLVNRCRPNPVVSRRIGAALPAFQDAPMCLCPALRPRPGLRAPGLRPTRGTSYFVHGGAVPP